jgi:hypothetical protein
VIASWEVDSARVSAFTSTAIQVSPLNVVTGTPITQTINNPAVQTTIDAGIFSTYGVVLSRSPRRVDLHFTVPPQAMISAFSISTLGDPNVVLHDLLTLAQKLFSPQPVDVQRLAVALTVGQSAASPQKALDLVLDHLRSVPKGVGPYREFLFQVNRPRTSKIDPSVEVNRLAKWQVAQVQTIQGTVGGSVQTTSLDRAILEIDINTSQKTNLIPGGDVVKYINDMGTMALEIVNRGDIP